VVHAVSVTKTTNIRTCFDINVRCHKQALTPDIKACDDSLNLSVLNSADSYFKL